MNRKMFKILRLLILILITCFLTSSSDKEKTFNDKPLAKLATNVALLAPILPTELFFLRRLLVPFILSPHRVAVEGVRFRGLAGRSDEGAREGPARGLP